MTEHDEYTPSVGRAADLYVRAREQPALDAGHLPAKYPDEYRAEFDRMIEAVRQEEREQLADAINAVRNHPTLIDLADKYGGWYQGQRTGLERAEGIARGQGKEQDR